MKVDFYSTKIILVTILAFLLASCQNEEPIIPDKKDDVNFVDQEAISQLASQILLPVVDATGKGTKSYRQKKVNNIMPVKEKGSNNTSLYVVNYDEGGFIIMSADNRIEPVLAFSESGKLPMNEELPAGLAGWFEETSEYVEEIKTSDTEQNIYMAEAWEPEAIQRVIANPIENEERDPPPTCVNSYEGVMPLLSTAWHQGVGYNDLVSINIGCSKYSNGRPPAGCVAIALAQIMRYHEHPKRAYNWVDMPDSHGTIYTARLVRDIGWAVGMEYSCDGSGASAEDAVKALRNTFEYSSATLSNFDVDVVVGQLKSKLPVYLSGGNKGQIIIFPYYEGGHAWVCDGYKRYITCYDTFAMMSTYLHMNWGWGLKSSSGKEFNGWFQYNRWNVSTDENDHDYNYKKKMIFNIKP